MILIGIDPGVQTGLAVSINGKLTRVETHGAVSAMREVLHLCQYGLPTGASPLVRFEDARKRKWFGSKGPEALQGAGSIKRDCSIWEEFCELHKIPFAPIAPAKGSTKWSDAQFRRLTGWEGRTSEHGRDAALLVWGAKPRRIE